MTSVLPVPGPPLTCRTRLVSLAMLASVTLTPSAKGLEHFLLFFRPCSLRRLEDSPSAPRLWVLFLAVDFLQQESTSMDASFEGGDAVCRQSTDHEVLLYGDKELADVRREVAVVGFQLEFIPAKHCLEMAASLGSFKTISTDKLEVVAVGIGAAFLWPESALVHVGKKKRGCPSSNENVHKLEGEVHGHSDVFVADPA